MSFQKNFFTTGEFAKLCNVTKDTLFYYEEIGLFCPVHTTKNGYRYYSVAQYDEMLMILSLRYIGISLKEIKRRLSARTPRVLLSLLDEEETEIDARIRALKVERQLSLIHISAGFLEIRPDETILFATTAEWPEEIDIARAERAKQRAEEKLRQRKSEEEYRQSHIALARAMARLKVGRKRLNLE